MKEEFIMNDYVIYALRKLIFSRPISLLKIYIKNQ